MLHVPTAALAILVMFQAARSVRCVPVVVVVDVAAHAMSQGDVMAQIKLILAALVQVQIIPPQMQILQSAPVAKAAIRLATHWDVDMKPKVVPHPWQAVSEHGQHTLAVAHVMEIHLHKVEIFQAAAAQVQTRHVVVVVVAAVVVAPAAL